MPANLLDALASLFLAGLIAFVVFYTFFSSLPDVIS